MTNKNQPEKTVGRWVKPFRRLWEISFKNAPTRIKRKDGTTIGIDSHEVFAKFKITNFISRLLAEKERKIETLTKTLNEANDIIVEFKKNKDKQKEEIIAEIEKLKWEPDKKCDCIKCVTIRMYNKDIDTLITNLKQKG